MSLGQNLAKSRPIKGMFDDAARKGVPRICPVLGPAAPSESILPEKGLFVLSRETAIAHSSFQPTICVGAKFVTC